LSYNPTNWQDRVVEHPRRFEVQNNPDGTVTLIPKPGAVLQEGTPVNAANMNKLEQGLKADIDSKLALAGGAMCGKLVAQSNTDYTVRQVRNIILSSNDPDPQLMQNGDIWLKWV
jgi:hypothetical protein